MSERPRILTGDTPTGKLHLGHWVGSVKRRVELQDTHDCFFIIANMHAFTTRSDKPEEIREDTLGIVRDMVAMGVDITKIDPEKIAQLLGERAPEKIMQPEMFAPKESATEEAAED